MKIDPKLIEKWWFTKTENALLEQNKENMRRIAELEANLKRATEALKAQQLETFCECKNCMNATAVIKSVTELEKQNERMD